MKGKWGITGEGARKENKELEKEEEKKKRSENRWKGDGEVGGKEKEDIENKQKNKQICEIEPYRQSKDKTLKRIWIIWR